MNDGDLIAKMSRETFYDTFVEQNTKEDMDKFMNEQFTYEKLVAEVGAPHNIFLIAEHEGKPAGYARLRENPDDISSVQSLEIARIYALKSMIGKGVGQALMSNILEIGKQMDKKFLWLGVWEKNLRAIEFYKKWGFQKFGQHDFVLGNDVQTDWMMRKEIL